jgi:hypothetical protein
MQVSSMINTPKSGLTAGCSPNAPQSSYHLPACQAHLTKLSRERLTLRSAAAADQRPARGGKKATHQHLAFAPIYSVFPAVGQSLATICICSRQLTQAATRRNSRSWTSSRFPDTGGCSRIRSWIGGARFRNYVIRARETPPSRCNCRADFRVGRRTTERP